MSLCQSLRLVGSIGVAGYQPLTDPLVEDVDLRPPTLVSTVAPSAAAVLLTLEGWPEQKPEELEVEPALGVVVTRRRETVEVNVGSQRPSAPYRLSATSRDAAGNTTWFVTAWRGHNPQSAQLLINELTSRRSSTKPNAIELLDREGG